MTDIITKPNVKDEIEVERPRLHKVILVNDDYTPREFVVMVLKAEFRMSEDQALRVMITAHRRGVCVVAVFMKDVAEAKATNASDTGRRLGYPLLFTILGVLGVVVAGWAVLVVPAAPPLPRARQTVADLARRLTSPGFVRPTLALAAASAALSVGVGFLPVVGAGRATAPAWPPDSPSPRSAAPPC